MKKEVFKTALIPLIISFVYFPVQADSIELKTKKASKEPVIYKPSGGYSLQEFDTSPEMMLCIEECKKHMQAASMGVEAIAEICQHKCTLENAQRLSKSLDPNDRKESTRILIEEGNKSVVPDLIRLLKEDMIARTGTWAEIIPALGRIRDKRAVPILSELAQMPDEDWLGRAMAINALGEIKDQSVTMILISAAWRTDTRDAAIAALAKLDDPRAASTLVSAIQPHEEQFTREAATSGLITLGSSAIESIYAEYINYSPENKQTQKRVWLCEILGTINSDKSKEILLKSYNDIDLAVKKCARKHL